MLKNESDNDYDKVSGDGLLGEIKVIKDCKHVENLPVSSPTNNTWSILYIYRALVQSYCQHTCEISDCLNVAGHCKRFYLIFSENTLILKGSFKFHLLPELRRNIRLSSRATVFIIANHQQWSKKDKHYHVVLRISSDTKWCVLSNILVSTWLTRRMSNDNAAISYHSNAYM